MRSKRELRGAVVVVTGASSGIGRATALALAREGARLVLAARRDEPLAEVVDECVLLGTQATAVTVDVTDPVAVDAVAQEAVARFGRLDVWVNNAGVVAWGRFDELPLDEFRRLIETNLFGYVHGARAALRPFRVQGNGTLIFVTSIAGKVGIPFASAYSASKFALQGLASSLRQELAGSGIDVCTVLPGTVDTPLFQHAANHTGREVVAMPPVISPERVAAAIVHVAARPRAEVIVGGAARVTAWLQRLTNTGIERFEHRQVRRLLFGDGPAPDTSGNLHAPVGRGTGVTGGWRAPRRLGPIAAAGGAMALLGLMMNARRLRRDLRPRAEDGGGAPDEPGLKA